MPLSLVLRYPAAVEEVIAVFRRPSFQESKAQAGALACRVVELTTGPDALLVRLERDMPPAGPKLARRFVGKVTLEHTERWWRREGTWTGRSEVTVQGSPASITGAMTLAPADDGTELRFELTATVKLPIFGGKLEKLLEKGARESLEAEHRLTLAALGASAGDGAAA
jgi:hypothetical protein